MQSVIHLCDADVSALVDRHDAVTAMRSAFAAWGRGTAATTRRARAVVDAGMASTMAAVVPPYCGGKIYATAGGRFTFLNVLFATDGQRLATLDGEAVTGLRTAATCQLAIDLLADPAATTATVVGTGRQARPHIEMLSTIKPHLSELRICGRPGSPETRHLVDLATAAGTPAVAYDGIESAVAGAQIVVTLTNSRSPLFGADVVADNALICAVGATKADRVEIGPDVVARCRTIVCDDVVGSRTECGDLIHAAELGRFDWSDAVELHALAADPSTSTPPTAGPTLFESQGVAIQDVALCGLAYERHLERRPPPPHPTPQEAQP